ncbi:hypothetical protein ACIBSR_38895 [Streptomyces sp. NPDC049936]|uniref:hypothetical protein n=1 Tax=Streptomyces sp. NPDC049936 TaxID=3365599 RepID=UPI0037AFEA3D
MTTRPARPAARRPFAEKDCGDVPLPGALLVWRDGRHYLHDDGAPCVLCRKPAHLRSHAGEPVHKICAEAWLTAHPAEALRGRFVSDA